MNTFSAMTLDELFALWASAHDSDCAECDFNDAVYLALGPEGCITRELERLRELVRLLAILARPIHNEEILEHK